MLFRNRPLAEVCEADLQALIDDRVAEHRSLDYKLELPAQNPPEKKREFLADISSFANAAGGFLIYGIREENGYPIELVGLDAATIEANVGRLVQALQDGIEPRIPGATYQRVNLANGKEVLIFAIPKSWNAPHAVWFEKNSKFWSRNTDNKFQLSVSEIRAAMVGSHLATESIRRFRDDRLGKVLARETPVKVPLPSFAVLQVTPVESFQTPLQFDLTKHRVAFDQLLLPIVHPGGWSPKWTFDGFLLHTSAQREGSLGYAHVFRNGAIEAVDGYMFSNLHRAPDDQKYMPSGFTRNISDALGRYLQLLDKLGILGPVLVSFSALNVKGLLLGFNNPYLFLDITPIEQDHLIGPEIYLEDRSQHPDAILRGTFDSIWNACGIASCNLYDQEGRLNRQ